MKIKLPHCYLTPLGLQASAMLLALSVLALWGFRLAAADTDLPQSPGSGGVLDFIYARDLPPLLERHRGKVVLVNFWATWCGPCIHEIPALLHLREKLDPSRFALIAISVDDPMDSSWLVPEFIENRFPQWNSYLSAEVEDYLMIEELDPHWPGVLPANYIIAPDGKLAKTLLGGHSEAQFEAAIHTEMAQSEKEPG